MKLHKAMCIFIILILLFSAAMVVTAQEETIDPVQVVQYTPPDEIATGLEAFLNEHMNIPALASLVLVLTAFTKQFLPHKITSKQTQFFWTIIIYAAYSIAANWGYTPELEKWGEIITKIGTILLGGTGTAIASHYGYQVTKNAGVPILGTARKKQEEVVHPSVTTSDWDG